MLEYIYLIDFSSVNVFRRLQLLLVFEELFPVSFNDVPLNALIISRQFLIIELFVKAMGN